MRSIPGVSVERKPAVLPLTHAEQNARMHDEPRRNRFRWYARCL